jgi:predicted nucleic acid-binding protein
MNLYLLDTNAISALMRAEVRITTWIAELSRADRILVCPIVSGEIYFGIARLEPGRRRNELAAKAAVLLESLDSEPVPVSAGGIYAEVKYQRQRAGLSLTENDLWIAATALALGAVLVSRDSDFKGIEGLKVVANW